MFLAMGVGAFGAGIFHLYTHAFFKACLFLGSGAVIHALHGEQDIRNMGGLKAGLPITYWTFLLGSLAIAGVPALAGFFSRTRFFSKPSRTATPFSGLSGLTSLLTATYISRLVFLTFHGERRHEDPRAPTSGRRGTHSTWSGCGPCCCTPRTSRIPRTPRTFMTPPPAMALALVVLALGSVLAGRYRRTRRRSAATTRLPSGWRRRFPRAR